MSYTDREESILKKEYEMWEAASKRHVVTFKKLVADNAIMICGGYRCLGVEYVEYIKEFYIKEYEIKYEEVIFSSEELVQIHYVIDIKTELPESSDLGGVFHVVSLWKLEKNEWKLYFNMDSRIITGGQLK